jgi:tetratricopeptide (TPR) repeat protein
MSDSIHTWKENLGHARRLAVYTAVIGEIIIALLAPPAGLSENLPLIRAPFLIIMEVLDKVFLGIILVEVIRETFARLTASWSLVKHFLLVSIVALILIAVGINFILPNKSIRYYARGSSLADQGDYKGAIEYFDIAVGLNPKNEKAYIERGHAYYSMGSFEKALLDWKQAVAIDPSQKKDLKKWIDDATEKVTVPPFSRGRQEKIDNKKPAQI